MEWAGAFHGSDLSHYALSIEVTTIYFKSIFYAHAAKEPTHVPRLIVSL